MLNVLVDLAILEMNVILQLILQVFTFFEDELHPLDTLSHHYNLLVEGSPIVSVLVRHYLLGAFTFGDLESPTEDLGDVVQLLLKLRQDIHYKGLSRLQLLLEHFLVLFLSLLLLITFKLRGVNGLLSRCIALSKYRHEVLIHIFV